jgi:hypothetical protein
VGDYLFDSTLNGVFDSADYVSDLILSRRKLKFLGGGSLTGMATVSGTLQQSYHDLYDGSKSYQDSIDEYFDEYYVRDLTAAIWRWRTPYTLLDCGSANGITLQRSFRYWHRGLGHRKQCLCPRHDTTEMAQSQSSERHPTNAFS